MIENIGGLGLPALLEALSGGGKPDSSIAGLDSILGGLGGGLLPGGHGDKFSSLFGGIGTAVPSKNLPGAGGGVLAQILSRGIN